MIKDIIYENDGRAIVFGKKGIKGEDLVRRLCKNAVEIFGDGDNKIDLFYYYEEDGVFYILDTDGPDVQIKCFTDVLDLINEVAKRSYSIGAFFN